MMALPSSTQLRYWGIAGAVLILMLWFLGQTLTPFVIGAVIAYCLDPIADRLEAMGLSRVLSTTVITLVAVFAFIILFLAIIPTLVNQTAALVNTAPELFTELQASLTTMFPELSDETSTLRQSLLRLGETIQAKGGELISGLASSALSIINVLVLLVIVPVVAFYLLLDWDNMVAVIDRNIPRDHVTVVRRLAREIDATLASFIRGQGTVCLVLGSYYAIALMLAGLQFGLVVGAIAGLITFIPYVGALVGGGLAVGLAIFQFWAHNTVVDGETVAVATNWFRIGLIGAIFALGQFLEGNVLTPKLVGNSVGLHPVWLLLALSVFGSLFGFIGLLVAVPLAAILGVVIRFFIQEYRKSLLFRGLDPDDE